MFDDSGELRVITIHRASADDLPALHPVLEQLMHAPELRRRAMWPIALAHPGYDAWVAQVNGSLAGFLDLVVFPDPAHGSWIGVISNLVVDKRFRRRGVGDRLLGAAIDHCSKRSVAELHVWTDAENEAALGLYAKRGFVRRGMLLELGIEPQARVPS